MPLLVECLNELCNICVHVYRRPSHWHWSEIVGWNENIAYAYSYNFWSHSGSAGNEEAPKVCYIMSILHISRPEYNY